MMRAGATYAAPVLRRDEAGGALAPRRARGGLAPERPATRTKRCAAFRGAALGRLAPPRSARPCGPPPLPSRRRLGATVSRSGRRT
jgi:hypothetical protein